MFKFITHDNTNPYFNLASEEYLLKQTKGFYIYLWVNAPAVIVGVNQNALEEVNLNFTQENDIKVVRRLTGGGAVYHDLNNLCYTVIAPYSEGENFYKKFTAPVIEYLKELGLNAEFSGRNDILIDGKKISGNAQTVFGDRVMIHGTLLFDSNLSVLSKALNPNKLKLQSKGIKSVRSRVTTIKGELNNDMSLAEFRQGLTNKFLLFSKPYEFSNYDKNQIELLVKNKYSLNQWNIGYSPKGSIAFEQKFEFGVFNFTFDVIDGKIQNALISGDFFEKKPINEFTERLNGIEFTIQQTNKAFSVIGEYIDNAKGLEITKQLFE